MTAMIMSRVSIETTKEGAEITRVTAGRATALKLEEGWMEKPQEHPRVKEYLLSNSIEIPGAYCPALRVEHCWVSVIKIQGVVAFYISIQTN